VTNGLFSVWAPDAGEVQLALGPRRYEMQRHPSGWWRAISAPPVEPGTRYGFAVDGAGPWPDPRSGWQPEGVDGLSAVVDHGSFPWTDSSWRGLSARGRVVYELHVGTFTPEGTFDAAIGRLEHLVELGVDMVELMPVAEFPGRWGWGYDGVDLFAPHHVYGGPDGLKRLIDASHAVGLGVAIDVVYNHFGPAGNHLVRFGPYLTDREGTNWGGAVNFSGPDSDEVRRFVIDNARMWLRDYHADALRLDAVHAIVDESPRHILAELAEEVDALATTTGRPLWLIAESDRNDRHLVRSLDADGYGMDATWADDWHHALHAVLSGEQDGYYEDFGSLEQLAKAIRQGWVYDGIWSSYRRRRHGSSPAGLAGHRFVVSAQNHDQIGNRARGGRSSALLSDGRLRIAAVLLLTGPFTPMLFQGEEWGATTPFRYFTDHEATLGQAVAKGRRDEFAAFGWDPDDIPDPQDPGTFEASKLDWDELDQPRQADLHRWYRLLIALRRSLPELSDPRLDRTAVETDEVKGTLVVHRGRVRVLVNLGSDDVRFPTDPSAALLAASDPRIGHHEGGVLVPADCVALVRNGETEADRSAAGEEGVGSAARQGVAAADDRRV
jgi:maltooligosyltrehalose trehalohydrolase